MRIQELKKKRLKRRKQYIRKVIHGDADNRLRFTVYRSLKHIYAQIINDVEGKTLCSASTLDKEVIEQFKDKMTKVDQARLVGALVAKKAVESDIKKVTFDRNGNLFHGRIKALADSARKNGLEF